MTDAPMFVAATEGWAKAKAVWPLTLAFAVIGLGWGLVSAFPITLEPQITDAGAAVSAQVGAALLHGVVILPAFLAACMIFKRGLSAVPVVLVAAAAFLTPLAAPFAGDAAGGLYYGKERAVLAALEADTSRRVATQEAKLAAADLGNLLAHKTFGDKDFPAYRARVKSYRDASEALRLIAEGGVKDLEARLAMSTVSPERQKTMLDEARAAALAEADRLKEIDSLRLKAADSADEGLDILERPNTWRVWYGQMSFGDPETGAVFGRHAGSVRASMATLRRLEGEGGVIGVSAQKQAS